VGAKGEQPGELVEVEDVAIDGTSTDSMETDSVAMHVIEIMKCKAME
jgi:hypothetical protein